MAAAGFPRCRSVRGYGGVSSSFMKLWRLPLYRRHQFVLFGVFLALLSVVVVSPVWVLAADRGSSPLISQRNGRVPQPLLQRLLVAGTHYKLCSLLSLHASHPDAVNDDAAPSAWRNRFPDLHPVVNVSLKSQVKGLATFTGAMMRKRNNRAVDLVLRSGNRTGSLLYALAYVSTRGNYSAQVLPRRRDGLFRMRIFRDLLVDEDSDPVVYPVSGKTNHSALCASLLRTLRPTRGYKIEGAPPSTMKLQFIGESASAKAMLAIEDLFWNSRREVSLTAGFVGRENMQKERDGQVAPHASEDDARGEDGVRPMVEVAVTLS